MTSETQKVCFTLYKIGQKSVKKLTLLTLNYFLTGTIRCSLTLPLFLSKSGTIPNSITLSQLYHMTTCKWWNHRPIILFSSSYNLPHKQIMTKVIEIVNLLLILYHFLDLDASFFRGFVTLCDIYIYIYIYIYVCVCVCVFFTYHLHTLP